MKLLGIALFPSRIWTRVRSCRVDGSSEVMLVDAELLDCDWTAGEVYGT